MALTEHTREQIAYVLPPGERFSVVRTTQEFGRNFVIESEGEDLVVVRHRSGATIAVSLGAGLITTAAITEPDAPRWPDARPARPTMPLHARTWGEIEATVRADLQSTVEVVQGPIIEVLATDAKAQYRWQFTLADTEDRDPLNLGEGTSACTDPVSWLLLALKLERDLPEDGPTALADLQLARASLEQVYRFVGDEDVVPAALLGSVGRSLTQSQPDRFTRGRLEMEMARLEQRIEALAHVGTRDPQIHLGAALFRVMQVPTRFEHLGRAMLDRISEAVLMASVHLHEAELMAPGHGELARRRSRLDALLEALLTARGELTPLPPLAQHPALHRVAMTPAHFTAQDAPEDGWSMVEEGLWRHEEGGVLLVHDDGERQLLENEEALMALRSVGHTLSPSQRETLQAQIEPGSDPRSALHALAQEPLWSITPAFEMDAGNGRLLEAWNIHAHEPRRSALLVTTLQADRALLGEVLLEGEDAVDQIIRFLLGATPPGSSVPGATGEPRELLALAQGGPASLRRLVVTEADVARLVLPSATAAVLSGLADIRELSLDLPPTPFHGVVFSAHTSTFGSDDPEASEFAGGWEMVAPVLQPLDWHALLLLGPEGQRVRLEGFVWLQDHWVWLPKPWRWVPARLLEASPDVTAH